MKKDFNIVIMLVGLVTELIKLVTAYKNSKK